MKSKLDRLKKKALDLKYKLQQVEAEIEDSTPKLKPGKYYRLQSYADFYYFKMHEDQKYDDKCLWIDKGLCIHYPKHGEYYSVTYVWHEPFCGWSKHNLVEVSKEEYKKEIDGFKHCYEELCEDIDDGQN